MVQTKNVTSDTTSIIMIYLSLIGLLQVKAKHCFLVMESNYRITSLKKYRLRKGYKINDVNSHEQIGKW